jgi:integrase
VNSGFAPRIFSQEEVGRLFSAADAIHPDARSPLRYQVMPELFRMLYGCGLRVGEATRLLVRNVNLHSGVVSIYQGKFRKDRLVPMASSPTRRLQRYADYLGNRSSEAVFFPAPDARPYHRHSIYRVFRELLRKCDIPHGGKGQGPRLHDLRHYAASRIMPTKLAVWQKSR